MYLGASASRYLLLNKLYPLLNKLKDSVLKKLRRYRCRCMDIFNFLPTLLFKLKKLFKLKVKLM